MQTVYLLASLSALDAPADTTAVAAVAPPGDPEVAIKEPVDVLPSSRTISSCLASFPKIPSEQMMYAPDKFTIEGVEPD